MRFSATNLGGGRNLHTTVIIGFMAVLLSFPAFSLSLPIPFPKDTLFINSHSFTVELATTELQQEQGLMFRTQLAEGHGMLFVFGEPRIAAMWMKNTLIPLDMLFIDSEGKIVHIGERATPQSEAIITSEIPVKAVLELAGGTCDKQDIKVGDIVSHATFHSRTAH